ncbi:MAG: glycosyltransferase family 2 protein [Chloroflexota bacterium]
MEVMRQWRWARRGLDAAVPPLTVAALGMTAWRSWQLYQSARAMTEQPPDEQASADRQNGLLMPTAGAGMPLVSVLVAAWNETDHLDALIDSFARLSYPNLELVLCAGGRDGTFELASRRASERVRVLHQEPGTGKQRALQKCYGVAQGEIIMLTDADCRFVDEAFSRLIAPILSGEATVTTGVSEPPASARQGGLIQYQWLLDRWWHQQLSEDCDGLLGRNCALTRAALEEVGAFAADVPTGTDYHLAQSLRRAGHRIRAVPSSRVISDYPSAPAAYVHMYERWHKNLLILGPRFGAWEDVRRVLIAFGIYSTMVTLPLAAPLLGRVALAVPGVLLVTSMLQRLARASAGARLAGARVSPSLVLHAGAATILDITAVFLAMYATLDPRRRTRW